MEENVATRETENFFFAHDQSYLAHCFLFALSKKKSSGST